MRTRTETDVAANPQCRCFSCAPDGAQGGSVGSGAYEDEVDTVLPIPVVHRGFAVLVDFEGARIASLERDYMRARNRARRTLGRFDATRAQMSLLPPHEAALHEDHAGSWNLRSPKVGIHIALCPLAEDPDVPAAADAVVIAAIGRGRIAGPILASRRRAWEIAAILRQRWQLRLATYSLEERRRPLGYRRYLDQIQFDAEVTRGVRSGRLNAV